MLPYPDIDPVAIRLGPLAIRWYGLAYLAAFACGWWLLVRRAAAGAGGFDREAVADLTFHVAVGAVIGGRLGYVLFYGAGRYWQDPLGVLRVWEGGMSFHGGLIGVLAAVAWFAHRTRRHFLAVTDFLAPVVPVGLGFGRLANFVNGELWGRPSEVPWAMVFPDPRAGGVPRHPSQLYEFALEGVLLFALLWWYSARPRPTGRVSALFLVAYGVLRFLVEFTREPDPQLGTIAFGWLTMGQALSLPMVLVGGWLWLVAGRDGGRSP